MLFNYKVSTKEGQTEEGSIEAPNVDLAISSLQRKGLIILDIKAEGATSGWQLKLPWTNGVKSKDIVILSRQISTLFEAKVSILSTFRLLASEAATPVLQNALIGITDDVKSGIPISGALARYPDIFSDFFISMVKAGEETGKLSETFNYLADYLERSYELTSKTKNALIYPAFVITSFIVVMILMITYVIPKLSAILLDTGQAIPFFTRLILGLSDFFVHYGLVMLAAVVLLGIFLARYLPTAAGKAAMSEFKLDIPYIGRLYKKLYLSRIADNLNTMLTSGISMVRALEITADVVDNNVYENIMRAAADKVKAGGAVSDALAIYPEIPGIMIQMMRVGEESGKLGFVLETLARFYRREVNNEVDTLVSLIEPALIVLLGVGVGILLTAVLVPIYNVAQGF